MRASKAFLLSVLTACAAPEPVIVHTIPTAPPPAPEIPSASASAEAPPAPPGPTLKVYLAATIPDDEQDLSLVNVSMGPLVSVSTYTTRSYSELAYFVNGRYMRDLGMVSPPPKTLGEWPATELLGFPPNLIAWTTAKLGGKLVPVELQHTPHGWVSSGKGDIGDIERQRTYRGKPIAIRAKRECDGQTDCRNEPWLSHFVKANIVALAGAKVTLPRLPTGMMPINIMPIDEDGLFVLGRHKGQPHAMRFDARGDLVSNNVIDLPDGCAGNRLEDWLLQRAAAGGVWIITRLLPHGPACLARSQGTSLRWVVRSPGDTSIRDIDVATDARNVTWVHIIKSEERYIARLRADDTIERHTISRNDGKPSESTGDERLREHAGELWLVGDRRAYTTHPVQEVLVARVK